MAPEPEVKIDRGLDVRGPQVRVWSTIGIKVPVPGLDYAMAEFSFGHERWAKSSSQEEIAKAARLVDEFNQDYVDKRLRKLLRDIRRLDSEVTNESGISSPKAKKGKKATLPPKSVQQRARERMGRK